MPEYLALGIGSPSEQESFDDTCVGISAMRTLQTVIHIEERHPHHLEISTGDWEFLTTNEEDGGEELNDEAETASEITMTVKPVPILKRFGAMYGSKADSRRDGHER